MTKTTLARESQEERMKRRLEYSLEGDKEAKWRGREGNKKF